MLCGELSPASHFPRSVGTSPRGAGSCGRCEPSRPAAAFPSPSAGDGRAIAGSPERDGDAGDNAVLLASGAEESQRSPLSNVSWKLFSTPSLLVPGLPTAGAMK